MKEKQKIIQKKELLNLVSDQTGYHMYQVEDILYGLGVVLADNITPELAVKVHGVGIFSYKKSRKLSNYSPLIGEIIEKDTKVSIKFKPCSELIRGINR